MDHKDLFLYSPVYSCHSFFLSSASVRFIPFLSFIVPIFAWNVPLVTLIFLKRSLVFPILLFSSIPFHWSLRKAFLNLSLLFFGTLHLDAYLFFSPLTLASLLFSVIWKASSIKHFAFLHFFSWGWSWSLPPELCHELLSIVIPALCLSDLVP